MTNCFSCAAPVNPHKEKCPACGCYYKKQIELTPALKNIMTGITLLQIFTYKLNKR